MIIVVNGKYCRGRGQGLIQDIVLIFPLNSLKKTMGNLGTPFKTQTWNFPVYISGV
jgi:hypothetical protein